jgi:hypothetical protein
MMNRIIPATDKDSPGSAVIESYLASPYTSIKHSSYFQVYEEVFTRYRNKPIIFVEIGILDGGSLFMWKRFLGDSARIIGVDMNPDAKRWESEGFEIFIGSQEDPDFWDRFFETVGSVDVVLDDGGHSNSQQIVTAHKVLPYIRDGGMLVVEDVHTSYIRQFGNPSKYSFINYCKRAINQINSRSSVLPWLRKHPSLIRDSVYACAFYESIVCFHVDRRKCFISESTINNGVKPISRDFRNEKYRPSFDSGKPLRSFGRSTVLIVLRLMSLIFFGNSKILLEKISTRKMKKYFK